MASQRSSHESSKHRWNGRRKLGACALASLIGLLVAEVAVRVWAPRIEARPRYAGEVLSATQGAAGTRRLIPGSTLEIRLGAPEDERVVLHRVGPHGWRGKPFAPRKPEGAVRIGCVGDSNVFGWGVGDDDTWPARLERELNSRSSAPNVEVLNLGVPNLDAEEKAWLVEHLAFELDCDLLLVALHFDDFLLDGIAPGALAGNARALARTQPGRLPWLDSVRKNLRVVDVVIEGWRRRMLASAYVTPKLNASREGRPARRRVEAALERMARLARERGVEVRALVLPMPVRKGAGWASDEVDAVLAAAARAAGIVTHEIGAELAQLGEELWVHPLDQHFNEAGHAAIARAVAERLEPAKLPRKTSAGASSEAPLEDRVDEGRDDRHGLEEDEHDGGREQDAQHGDQPPVRPAPQRSKELERRGDAGANTEERPTHGASRENGGAAPHAAKPASVGSFSSRRRGWESPTPPPMGHGR